MKPKKHDTDPDPESDAQEQVDEATAKTEEIRDIQEKAAASRHERSPETREAQEDAAERLKVAEARAEQRKKDAEVADKAFAEEQAHIDSLPLKDRIEERGLWLEREKAVVKRIETLRLADMRDLEAQMYAEGEELSRKAKERMLADAARSEQHRQVVG